MFFYSLSLSLYRPLSILYFNSSFAYTQSHSVCNSLTVMDKSYAHSLPLPLSTESINNSTKLVIYVEGKRDCHIALMRDYTENQQNGYDYEFRK